MLGAVVALKRGFHKGVGLVELPKGADDEPELEPWLFEPNVPLTVGLDTFPVADVVPGDKPNEPSVVVAPLLGLDPPFNEPVNKDPLFNEPVNKDSPFPGSRNKDPPFPGFRNKEP